MGLLESIFPILLFALLIAVRVLFTAAAYNDALSKLNQNALM
jgi:hypothetical protein